MIDGIGGVSMGAFVGAMDASGVDADEMDALLRGVGAASRAAAYTVLRHALIRGARVEAMLGRVFGTVAIEELRRGSFCASADLRSGQFVVSRFGPPAESVGLGMRMPVLAPAQVRGRRELVDGSLIDNLPLSTLAALGEGPLITVDVKASFDREGRTKHRRGRDPGAEPGRDAHSGSCASPARTPRRPPGATPTSRSSRGARASGC